MPAYNHEKYVETAVRSVLNQGWPRIVMIRQENLGARENGAGS